VFGLVGILLGVVLLVLGVLAFVARIVDGLVVSLLLGPCPGRLTE
jgi:hypothetical protein